MNFSERRGEQIRLKRAKKRARLIVEMKQAKYLYLLLLLPTVYFVVFHYLPMYGIIMAFQDYNVFKGFAASPFVGPKHFINFLSDARMPMLIKNTLRIGFVTFLFGGWPNIIFALMLNEFRNGWFRKTILTVTNIPNYISQVILCGMIINLLSPSDGLINQILTSLGMRSIFFIVEPRWFDVIYVGSGVWQGLGFGAVLYLGVIANISVELYEAADIEGANRLQKAWRITVPHLMPTFVLMMIMSVGSIVGPSFEKIMLLYTPSTYEVADVISTYTYRKGIAQGQYSYATAIGLFNMVISLAIVLLANWIARATSDYAMF